MPSDGDQNDPENVFPTATKDKIMRVTQLIYHWLAMRTDKLEPGNSHVGLAQIWLGAMGLKSDLHRIERSGCSTG